MLEKTTQRWRRLIARRLRRRPLLPFLLAATVAVDLVIAVRFARPELQYPSLTINGFDAFCLAFFSGQVSLLGLWVWYTQRHWAFRLAAAIQLFVLGLHSAFLNRGWPIGWDTSTAAIIGLTIYAVYPVFTLVVRIVRKQWKPGIFETRRRIERPIRVSMGELLTLMTFVALVAAVWSWASFNELGVVSTLVAAAVNAIYTCLLAWSARSRRAWGVVGIGVPILVGIWQASIAPYYSWHWGLMASAAMLTHTSTVLLWLKGLQVRPRQSKPTGSAGGSVVSAKRATAPASHHESTPEPLTRIDIQG